MRAHPMYQRNTATARRIIEILGLPDDMMWSDIKLELEYDDVGVVALRILPTSEQWTQLADLAVKGWP